MEERHRESAYAAVGFYEREAARLCRDYDALDPARIYASCIHLFPAAPAAVLDVASGSGRDAAWLASQGHDVTAVEPAEAMRAHAAAAHAGLPVRWTAGSLPGLDGVDAPGPGFGFILAAAVWMHLPDRSRTAAARRLATLAAPGARVIITLRHGPGDPERPMHPVDAGTEALRALGAGFSSAVVIPSDADMMGRSEVSWETLALMR